MEGAHELGVGIKVQANRSDVDSSVQEQGSFKQHCVRGWVAVSRKVANVIFQSPYIRLEFPFNLTAKELSPTSVFLLLISEKSGAEFRFPVEDLRPAWSESALPWFTELCAGL